MKMEIPPLHEILRRIDHAVLKPWQTRYDVDRAVREATELGLRGIIVSPSLLHYLRDTYSEGIRGVVVGFPFGYHHLEAKIKELERALADEPDEVDAVINYQRLILGDYNYVYNEAAALTELCHDVGVKIKLIIEAPVTAQNPQTLYKAVEIAVKAGADYIKTSTGFGPRKTIPEDVAAINKILEDMNVRSKIGIKAAGGIRSALQAILMLKAGADIIGTSTPSTIRETYTFLKQFYEEKLDNQ